MTTTYDPHNPVYFDDDDLHKELDRVFDHCHGCRLCFNLCPSFESLFSLIDEKTDGIDVALPRQDNDRIVDECYQCKLCYIKCPYTPPHEWKLDFPRLMLRARAARSNGRPNSMTDRFLGATDFSGKAGTMASGIANAANRNGTVRTIMEKTLGIARERLLPPYAKERFSTWFRREGRAKSLAAAKPGAPTATLFPTCLVEYNDPSIGKAAVEILDTCGVSVNCPETVCCGMPSLDGGDVKGFIEKARRNVEKLAPEAKAGRAIIVPQPTCGYVLRNEYPEYLKTEDAQIVADATVDSGEYLFKLKKEGIFEPEFTESLGKVAYHAPCHLRAQGKGLKARDIIKTIPDTEVTVAEGCSGIDGTWGYKAKWYEMARKVAAPMIGRIEKVEPDVIVGDCVLADTAIEQETEKKPIHPLHAIARAMGMKGEVAGEGGRRKSGSDATREGRPEGHSDESDGDSR